MPVRNFAFGSHLVKERMSKSIGAEPQKSLRATLSNYRLTFWKVNTYPEEFDRYATSGDFPVLVPANGNPVHGAAYMISEDQLAGLDKSEREFGYERAEFLVDIPEMGSVRAFAHNRNDNGEFYPPSQDFLEIMLQGLKEHGYSADIIEERKESARASR